RFRDSPPHFAARHRPVSAADLRTLNKSRRKYSIAMGGTASTMSSSDLEQQIAKLSPAKQALLARKRSQSTAHPIVHRGAHPNGAPLSSAQQSIWLIHQLDPQSYLYNVPRALRLVGKLDRGALEASLNEIIRRHDTLRTTFRTESGKPVQIIAPEL